MARYPQLVRAHVRGGTLQPGVADELARYFNSRPADRACEAADHGFDPVTDPARYVAEELAEPEHASLRGGPVTVETIHQWEGQEDAEHSGHVRKDAGGGDVYAMLAKNYPASAIRWAKDVEWRKADVSLADIQMARRPGGRDQGKVEGIAQALDDGKQMDRVVLVKTPGNDRYEIADGYHRTLAFQHADRKTIPAYVGKVSTDDGPWVSEMHDAKLNKSAYPVLVLRKDEPTASDVHVDTASNIVAGKKRRKDGEDEPELSILKADDEQRIVWGIVLEPDVEDSQGDVVSKEDVELAAHRFLYGGALIGNQHRALAPASVKPVESYVAPCDFEMGGEDVRKGTWVMAVHIPDDPLWNEVKTGRKGALSVAGTGKRRPL